MMFHILTRNAYAITSLVTLTLGSFYIANHTYERWLSRYNLQLIDSNLITKLLIVLLGTFVVSFKALFDVSLEKNILMAFAGILIGCVNLLLESYFISLFCKSQAYPSRINFNNSVSKNILNNIKKKNTAINIKPSYFSIIMVGSLEEILYRGFLTALCIVYLNPNINILALLIITVIFSINHINLGNIHVLTKLILGLVCLLSFLITKTLITPVFIHATFNALVIRKYRKVIL